MKIIKKGTKLYSILFSKCPRCHNGDFFKYKFTFHPSKVTTLHKNCPNCNFKYMIEPSFFYGAMYVNYAVTVAQSIISFLIAKFIFNLSLLYCLLIVFVILLVLSPFNIRISRVLWINMFVNYDEKKEVGRMKREV